MLPPAAKPARHASSPERADIYKFGGKWPPAYGPYPGMSDVIDEIRKWMSERGFDMESSDIEILPGSTHGIQNAARMVAQR